MRFCLEVLLGLLMLVMIIGMLLFPRANTLISEPPCGRMPDGYTPNATLQRCVEFSLRQTSVHPLDAVGWCCDKAER